MATIIRWWKLEPIKCNEPDAHNATPIFAAKHLLIRVHIDAAWIITDWTPPKVPRSTLHCVKKVQPRSTVLSNQYR